MDIIVEMRAEFGCPLCSIIKKYNLIGPGYCKRNAAASGPVFKHKKSLEVSFLNFVE